VKSTEHVLVISPVDLIGNCCVVVVARNHSNTVTVRAFEVLPTDPNSSVMIGGYGVVTYNISHRGEMSVAASANSYQAAQEALAEVVTGWVKLLDDTAREKLAQRARLSNLYLVGEGGVEYSAVVKNVSLA
jgi:uncharacterized membrane-anchored protein